MTMAHHIRVEGYAIVSADGMLTDRNGQMPDGLNIDADARFMVATRTSNRRVRVTAGGWSLPIESRPPASIHQSPTHGFGIRPGHRSPKLARRLG
jgi:hypothetical protein